MSNEKFWMVFVMDGHSPTKCHPTKLAAEIEAQRQARATGSVVYVLETIYGYRLPEQSVSRFELVNAPNAKG